MNHHMHAYTWIGDGRLKEYEAERRPPTELMTQMHPTAMATFRSSPIPPLRCCDWLLKPASAIKVSFSDPDAAVEWLAAAYHQLAGMLAYEEAQIGREIRLDNAADMLPRRVDVQWGMWLQGGRFASVAVICCPNTFSDYRCPAG